MKKVKIGNHILVRGDCLRVMPKFPARKIDLVLCDPPYGTTANKWDIILPFDRLWNCYNHVAKLDAPLVLFSAQPFTTDLIQSNRKNFRYVWIWEKNTQTGIALAGKQPMRKHEDLVVFYRKFGTFNPQMRPTESAIMLAHAKRGYTRGTKATGTDHMPGMQMRRTPFSALINPCTILKFNTLSNRSKDKHHPTQKPVDLLRYLVLTYTNKGDRVLDNCMGAGSTGVACVEEGRAFVGIERNREYFDVACDRINDAYKKRKSRQ